MHIALLSTDSDLWGFGIRQLSSVLKTAGHATRLLFLPSELQRYPDSVLSQTLALVKWADLIGVSCYSRGASKAAQLIASLRCLRKPIIWGGLHATINPAECANAADLVCRGEGEHTIVEVAEAMSSGKDWEGIGNLAFRRNGNLVVNPVRPPVENLDHLPLFDFDRRNEFHLAGEDLRPAFSGARESFKQALFIGSRGCAFRCTYCCNRSLKEVYNGHRNYLRRLSPARYVEQVSALQQSHFPTASDFFFVDEDFFLRSAAELKEFSQLYRERVGIPFECMVSPARVTEEKVDLLVQAGLWRLRMGIESGSEQTKRKVYDRPISNDAVLKAARTISRRPAVVPAYFFMTGNPYETSEDVADTLKLMQALPYPYYSQVFNLVFFPGSALYDRAVRDGLIAGFTDSGCELHYRKDFDPGALAWKQKNLYLNTLVLLADGKSTRFRVGFLPRLLIPLLTHAAVVSFMERRKRLVHGMIRGKALAMSVRSLVGAPVKRWMRDPGGVYNLPLYFKKAARRYVARCGRILPFRTAR
jgi:radical SAM superfamily enzyme YgiQ (UPF0313 family)